MKAISKTNKKLVFKVDKLGKKKFSGTCIKTDGTWKIGQYCSILDSTKFKFNGN